jgi:ribosomal protein L17
MNWYDTNFDPLQALHELHNNQKQLNRNQEIMNQNIQNMHLKILEQDQIIDTLLKSIELGNKANELLLNNLDQQIKQALEKVND